MYYWCGMQDYAAKFMYLQVGRRCEAVLKFFTKTKKKQKNKKKMLFFASHDSRRQSRFFAKKYYPRGVEIFFQKPEGLDLDGLGNQG